MSQGKEANESSEPPDRQLGQLPSVTADGNSQGSHRLSQRAGVSANGSTLASALLDNTVRLAGKRTKAGMAVGRPLKDDLRARLSPEAIERRHPNAASKEATGN